MDKALAMQAWEPESPCLALMEKMILPLFVHSKLSLWELTSQAVYMKSQDQDSVKTLFKKTQKGELLFIFFNSNVSAKEDLWVQTTGIQLTL